MTRTPCDHSDWYYTGSGARWCKDCEHWEYNDKWNGIQGDSQSMRCVPMLNKMDFPPALENGPAPFGTDY